MGTMRATPVLLLTAAIAAHATPCLAFCRTTTMQPEEQLCPAECVFDGEPLFWGQADLQYTFNSRGFPGIDEPTLREVFARSFAAWSEVECDGMQTGLTISASDEVTPLTVGPKRSEPNLNVISFLEADEWAALGFLPQELAKTKVWYRPTTGEIIGADIAFNGGIGVFSACLDGTCPAGSIDLQNVATHEIGHFLGLAHSEHEDATLWCDAVAADQDKRSLTPDDGAGLCAIYADGTAFAPEPEAPDGSAQGAESGCALSPKMPGNTQGLAGWLLLAACLGLARRRRHSDSAKTCVQ